MTRFRKVWQRLRWREFRLRPLRCPFCGPNLVVRLSRDDEAAIRCVRCAASTVHLAMGLAIRETLPDRKSVV